MGTSAKGSPAALGWDETIPSGGSATYDGMVLKKVIDARDAGENLLKADAWTAFRPRLRQQDGIFTCDNGSNAKVQRGVSQTVVLNQTRARAHRRDGVEQGPERRRQPGQRLLSLYRPRLSRRLAPVGPGGRLQCRLTRLGEGPGHDLSGKAHQERDPQPAAAQPRGKGLVPRCRLHRSERRR